MSESLKIGMVGLDTSHCVAFARLLNDAEDPYYVPGARVVAAYPGGSDAFSLSRNRVAGFTERLRDEFGVVMVDSIRDLVRDVDAILLESVDGRQHLEQFRQLAVGKPVYIDKPLTTSTEEARALIALAAETGTPLMSTSSLRYAAGIADLVPTDETVVSCEAFGPAAILDDYPGLFWYGIHSAEVLFTMMCAESASAESASAESACAGCESVRTITYPETDVVIGTWADGRVGVLRGTRFAKGSFGCVVHTDAGTHVGLAQSTPPYYALMLQDVIAFFQAGISPIPVEETFNIIAFLEAADASKAQGGDVVSVATL